MQIGSGQTRKSLRVFGPGAKAPLLALALAMALAGCASAPAATVAVARPVSTTASALSTAPITKGQKIVMATHSFNVFVGPRGPNARNPDAPASPGPLAALAAERGKAGHDTLAVQMIGGSTPMQHWNQGDGDDARNIAKAALVKGSIDVLTMSPNATMPEPGIDLFGDLVIKSNPNARIMVQNSWSAWDGKGSTKSVGGSGAPAGVTNEDHDKATLAEIEGWIADLDAANGYLTRMRAQLRGVNQRAGREIAYVVPSATSVYTLRKEIIQGAVPGVAKQSGIFRDAMGHPSQPLANVVTYTWYAAMYRESPVGLKALIDASDPTSAARERLLQQIAWNAVVAEPMSGVTGKPVQVGG
ncbi:MAG: hypothetical protein SGJ21_01175 [Alphaproteobacteria bacterium]|nr:hypothetical protein [Alphaproteobacteria bacterium]